MKFAKKVCILWCQRFIPKQFLFLKSPLGRFGNFQVGEAARSKEPRSDGASGLECVFKLHRTGTPSSLALSYLEPGSVPTTT